MLEAVVILALAIGEPVSAQAPGFDAALYRTKAGGNVTLVDGVLEFDPRIVDGGVDCAYNVGVTVTDSTDTEIYRDRWRSVLACESDEAAPTSEGNVVVVETFQFAVVPGRYSLEVSLEPAGMPGMAQLRAFELTSLGEHDATSDLILAREVGRVDSTEARRWTIQRRGLGIAADPYVVVDPSTPRLSYYMELYSEALAGQSGRVEGVIRRPGGDEVVRMKLDDLETTAENRPIAGTIPLQGLPPGDYLLEVQLALGNRSVTRSQPFQMLPVDQSESTVVELAPTRADHLETYFWSLTDEELTELFDPIVVWLTTGNERKMFESLNSNGRRNFLVAYFRYRAPLQLGGGDESPLDVYLSRVRVINQRFGEKVGRTDFSAWRTERGRVYMMRGEPDRRVDRRAPAGNSPPFEIWMYYYSPGYTYLFVDETGFDDYRLLFSSDPSNPSVFDWERRAGEVAVTELFNVTGGR
jgi:GWxTD domain-containing protein